MQGKKLSVLVIIIVFLVIGWYVSVKTASGVDELTAQTELVEKADKFASKELYVRAIPLYKEALEYSTDNNLDIQTKLLDAYENHGDTSLFIDLVESRREAGTATEEEYLKLAQYYYKISDMTQSMAVAKEGAAKFDSSALQEFYEENKFSKWSSRVVGYDVLVPSEKNTYMAAYDGEKWVYIDSTGSLMNIGEFDTATPFNNNGYAVVSENGKYRTILKSGEKYGIDETGIDEAYRFNGSALIAKVNGKFGYYNYDFVKILDKDFDEITVTKSGAAAVRDGDRWGIIDESGATLVDFEYLDVAISSIGTAFYGGHAMVKTSEGWQMIDINGNVLVSDVYSDAKAPESNNGYIAVANANGKWGFIDLNGNLVIDYKYDDAKSFSNGLAAVCLGDKWQYIDGKGVVRIDLALDDAEPFHNGIAQAHTVDGSAIVTLNYFE
jgi:hypothetical protein